MMKRIPELDGVRGLACLQVLLLHYVAHQAALGEGWLVRPVARLLGMGWMGVDLFFVLSGFLLGGILLDQRQSPNLLPVFYLRRACRILPIYFAWFAILLLLMQVPAVAQLCDSPVPSWSFALQLQNIFMVAHQSWGPPWMSATWSLAVEEQFYLLLPAIICLCPSCWLPWLLAVLVLSSVACRVVLSWCWPEDMFAPYMLLPCRADALFLGVLGAWGLREPRLAGWLRERVWLLRGVTLLLGMGVYFVLGRWGIDSSRIKEAGYTWIAAFFLSLLLLTLHDRRIARVFRWRPLMALGAISYGVYVVHFPICCLLHRVLLGEVPRIVDWTTGGVTLLALGVTLLVAGLSYRFFESPIISLGRRWRYAPASAKEPALEIAAIGYLRRAG
jgi:peptidoglycan/LPS O-acetylase OafA/YrhL